MNKMIQNEKELRKAYNEIMESVAKLAPGKEIAGIMAEEMVSDIDPEYVTDLFMNMMGSILK